MKVEVDRKASMILINKQNLQIQSKNNNNNNNNKKQKQNKKRMGETKKEIKSKPEQ